MKILWHPLIAFYDALSRWNSYNFGMIASEYRHRALLSSRRQLFARVRSKWFTICFFVFCIRYFRRRLPKRSFNCVRTHTNLFSAPLFRLLHFSRPPLLTSGCYLSFATYSPGKNILGQEWDLWICRAKSWVIFMVRMLLPHFRAYRVTMYLCQWCM